MDREPRSVGKQKMKPRLTQERGILISGMGRP
jgi:hypothetical protein